MDRQEAFDKLAAEFAEQDASANEHDFGQEGDFAQQQGFESFEAPALQPPATHAILRLLKAGDWMDLRLKAGDSVRHFLYQKEWFSQ